MKIEGVYMTTYFASILGTLEREGPVRKDLLSRGVRWYMRQGLVLDLGNGFCELSAKGKRVIDGYWERVAQIKRWRRQVWPWVLREKLPLSPMPDGAWDHSTRLRAQAVFEEMTATVMVSFREGSITSASVSLWEINGVEKSRVLVTRKAAGQCCPDFWKKFCDVYHEHCVAATLAGV